MLVITLADICRVLKCAVPEGDGAKIFKRIDSLEHADSDALTFIVNPKITQTAATSHAGAFIVAQGHLVPGRMCLEVKNPYLGYAQVAQLFEDTTPPFGVGVSKDALVDATAHIASDVHIGPGAVIGAHCTIGAGTVINARSVIEKECSIGTYCRVDAGAIIHQGTSIGNRVIIQSNAVIGSEGFGNAQDGHTFVRIPCFGNVIIEDDAEIGAGTMIDRGNFQPTVIRRGARIDNLVMVAHNVEIGEDTAIAAQTGFSGSTKVGKRVIIGGQAGFAGHITIGDDVFVGAQAGVSKSVASGSKITGTIARNLMDMRRQEAATAKLPGVLKEVRRLRTELNVVKEKI